MGFFQVEKLDKKSLVYLINQFRLLTRKSEEEKQKRLGHAKKDAHPSHSHHSTINATNREFPSEAEMRANLPSSV